MAISWILLCVCVSSVWFSLTSSLYPYLSSFLCHLRANTMEEIQKVLLTLLCVSVRVYSTPLILILAFPRLHERKEPPAS